MRPKPRPLRALVDILGHRTKRHKDLDNDKDTRHDIKGIRDVNDRRKQLPPDPRLLLRLSPPDPKHAEGKVEPRSSRDDRHEPANGHDDQQRQAASTPDDGLGRCRKGKPPAEDMDQRMHDRDDPDDRGLGTGRRRRGVVVRDPNQWALLEATEVEKGRNLSLAVPDRVLDQLYGCIDKRFSRIIANLLLVVGDDEKVGDDPVQ